MAPQAAPSTYAGLDVVIAPTGGTTYVVGRSGCWLQTQSPAQLMMTEPWIGGVEIAVLTGVVCDVQTGAAATVAAA